MRTLTLIATLSFLTLAAVTAVAPTATAGGPCKVLPPISSLVDVDDDCVVIVTVPELQACLWNGHWHEDSVGPLLVVRHYHCHDPYS